MSIIELIIILAVIGLILWVVNRYIPMDPTFKQILNVIVLIAILLWLVSAFFGGFNIRVR